MPITVINGDILDAFDDGVDYIAYKCNCNTIKSHGLSASIAHRFPWAKRISHGSRTPEHEPEIPGTLKILSEAEEDKDTDAGKEEGELNEPEVKNKYVICLFADDKSEWFQSCINELDKLGLDKVAMPNNIGCASGKWSIYEKILQNAKTNIILYEK